MNPALVVASCAVLSAGATYLVIRYTPRETGVAVQDTGLRGADPAERIATLEQTVRDLETRLRAFDPANVRRAEPTVDEERLARAVAARLGIQAGGERSGSAPSAANAAARKDGKDANAAGARAVEDIVAQLLDPKTDFNSRTDLWKKAKEAGLADQVLAAFEERARNEPNNSKAQTDLGIALLSKMLQTEQGPAAWSLSARADKSFDRALEIDDHNWDARFQKAVSLSFWPPALGRGPEAVKNFEVLVQQQKDAPQRAEFAQSYLFLGNLYDQQGKHDKALEVWRQGLSAFPDNGDLKSKVR